MFEKLLSERHPLSKGAVSETFNLVSASYESTRELVAQVGINERQMLLKAVVKSYLAIHDAILAHQLK